MPIRTVAVAAAVVLLAGLAVFQLLLAAGAPLGRAAWGGRHRTLPATLRRASLAAVGVLAAAAWVVLARAGTLPPGPEPLWIRAAAWVFGAYFTFNTVANAVSRSPAERVVMTPVAALLAASFVVVALA